VGSLRGRRRRRRRVRIGAPDPSLTPVAGMVAVTELVERLDVIGRLDAAIGPIKQRRRGHTGGHQPRGRGGHHRLDPHPHRPAGARRTRHRQLSPRHRREPPTVGGVADRSSRPARAVELHHCPYRRTARGHRRRQLPRAHPCPNRGVAAAGRATVDRHGSRSAGHAGPRAGPGTRCASRPAPLRTTRWTTAVGHRARAAQACSPPPTEC